ncbi:YncE family protein [Frateuria aurantia]
MDVIDVDTHQRIAVIPGTAGAHGVALAPGLHRGFISNGQSNAITVFDLTDNHVLATIHDVGGKPDAVVFDPASGHVFSFNGREHSVSAIDARRARVIGKIALPGKPEFAQADGQGHIYVNIEDLSELAVIDSRRFRLSYRWPLPGCRSPSGLALDAAHYRLFSVCGNRHLAVTDATNGHSVAIVPIGQGPDAVVYDPARHMIYSSDGRSGEISVIHQITADRYERVGALTTPWGSRTMTIDPLGHVLYLSTAKVITPLGLTEKPRFIPGSFVLWALPAPWH